MSLDETEFARFAAGSVFIAVPIVLLYFFLVKDMVNGMAAGRGERVIRSIWQPPQKGDPEYKVAAAAEG